MRRKRFASWNKEVNLSGWESTSTPSGVDLFPRPFAIMPTRCHWYLAVFLHLARNVAILPKSVAKMYQSNIAIKFLTKRKRWNVLVVIKLVDMTVRMKDPVAINVYT